MEQCETRPQHIFMGGGTGTGKTEAVLAPCIERMIQTGRAGALIYVVPTRALAD